jgi:Na+/H+ antiporter NhaD/arsenite permease-like protein
VDDVVLAIFAIVYIGMILGRLPGLALDRTGIALLGAIGLLALGKVGMGEIGKAVDESTIALLFGLMIVSAQFRLSGLYSYLVRRLAIVRASPRILLALLIVLVGLLSAVLVNDVVCLAMAPVLVETCSRRGLDPKPFLLALACAANVGSMATLIGNPQNMLIGQVLHLSFSHYAAIALVPSVLGLVVVWVVLVWKYDRRWTAPRWRISVEAPPYNQWQTTKGLVLLGGLVIVFLFSSMPRDIMALGAAGILLCSRQMRSREVLGIVDWQLLVLFLGLFIVNYAVESSGSLSLLMNGSAELGVDPQKPLVLFVGSAILSNLVSNVPAVMLLLPSAGHPLGGPILAFASTLSGNLLIVGSIANIIVVDQAARMGVSMTWREHARIGVPVTVLTLIIAGLWLIIISG